jgi:hypothetical protein
LSHTDVIYTSCRDVTCHVSTKILIFPYTAIFPIYATKIYSSASKYLNTLREYIYSIFEGITMTLNAILTISNILDNKINHDLLTLKEKLQHTVHSQKFNVSVTTAYAEIKILLKNIIDNSEIIEKSRKLEQVSNLCSQKGKLIKKQYENEFVEFVEQIDYLMKLAAFYLYIYYSHNLDCKDYYHRDY